MSRTSSAATLRPFPFPESERLTRVWERFQSFPRTGVSWLNFRDWSERTTTFESMAGFFPYPRRMAARDGTIEQIPAMQVTTRYFEVLGIKPIAGRTFRPSDVAFPPNTMVISEGLWRTRFGADPSVVGRTIQVDGGPVTVLGVVPGEAQVVGRPGLWTLWAELPGMDARGLHFLGEVGLRSADHQR